MDAARAQRSGSALYGKEVIRGATAAVRTRRRGAIRQRRAIARGMAVNGGVCEEDLHSALVALIFGGWAGGAGYGGAPHVL